MCNEFLHRFSPVTKYTVNIERNYIAENSLNQFKSSISSLSEIVLKSCIWTIYSTFYLPCRAESLSDLFDRLSSVCLYVRLSVKFPHFLLFQNNFSQTWHKAALGQMNGKALFQGKIIPISRIYIHEILEIIFYGNTGPVSIWQKPWVKGSLFFKSLDQCYDIIIAFRKYVNWFKLFATCTM